MKLAIMVGLPLAGKSTVAKRLQSMGWVRVCPDEVRLALYGQQFIAEVEPFVWANAELAVRALLLGDHNVVIDATNTTVERRKQWARVAKCYGVPLQIFCVNTPYETCIERNKNLDRLNPDIIDRMHGQYEPPTEFEGDIVDAQSLFAECKLKE